MSFLPRLDTASIALSQSPSPSQPQSRDQSRQQSSRQVSSSSSSGGWQHIREEYEVDPARGEAHDGDDRGVRTDREVDSRDGQVRDKVAERGLGESSFKVSVSSSQQSAEEHRDALIHRLTYLAQQLAMDQTLSDEDLLKLHHGVDELEKDFYVDDVIDDEEEGVGEGQREGQGKNHEEDQISNLEQEQVRILADGFQEANEEDLEQDQETYSGGEERQKEEDETAPKSPAEEHHLGEHFLQDHYFSSSQYLGYNSDEYDKSLTTPSYFDMLESNASPTDARAPSHAQSHSRPGTGITRPRTASRPGTGTRPGPELQQERPGFPLPSLPELMGESLDLKAEMAAVQTRLVAERAEELCEKVSRTVKELQERREEVNHIHELLVARAERAAQRILQLEKQLSDMDTEFDSNQSELSYLRLQLRALEVQYQRFVPQEYEDELSESIRNWKLDWADVEERTRMRRRKLRESIDLPGFDDQVLEIP